MSDTTAAPRPLRQYGRFAVVRQIGAGGTGRVLEAMDPDLERLVALKVVPVGDDAQKRDTLLAEARIAGKLEHPNIVPVYEMGAEQGWLYFAMRRIEGHSLSQVLRGRSRNESWADGWTRHKLLAAFLTLCRAVAYAHEQGVIHQDLKPANVMLGGYGEVQLVDWGIATSLEAPAESDLPSDIVRGTPGYISPERVRGQRDDVVDERSDIWALGVILYEMLTLKRAFTGKTPVEVLLASLRRPAQDPRALVKANVPSDLAAIVARATAIKQEDRFESVLALCHAVEGWIDGRARRERAAEHLSEAHVFWADVRAIVDRRERLLEQLGDETARVPDWAPLVQKGRVLELRQQLVDLEPKRAALFGKAVGAAERAVTEDPDNRSARSFLARAFWSRFLGAEAAGDRVDMTFFMARVQEWDDGQLQDEIRGDGLLSIHTNPAGAEVLCQRYDTDHFIWRLEEQTSLGCTPIDELPMEMGRYRLIIRHPDHDDAIYPVWITRKRHWDVRDEPLKLPRARRIADGFVFVPAGPFQRGGDPEAQDGQAAEEVYVDSFAIAVDQVTMGDWCEFINALHVIDPEQAWNRCPRWESGVKTNAGQYWDRAPADGLYVVPELDRDGDPWDPTWPVMGVSWEDATAYAEWRSERDGNDYRLPTELEWEKAARGVDARLFPWGDGFDPSLCHMRLSREGRPQPEPIGSFATDVSVYGMRDVSGGVRDWCCETSYEGADNRRPVRGGSWDSHVRYCRISHRTGYTPWYVATSFGLRLVQVLQSKDEDDTMRMAVVDPADSISTAAASTGPVWTIDEDWLD